MDKETINTKEEKVESSSDSKEVVASKEVNDAPKTEKTPEMPKAKGCNKPRGVLMGLVAAALMLVALVGGIALGRTLGKAQQDEVDNGDTTTTLPTDSPLLGGGGGVPVSEVALLPENDKLTLAFLRLHNVRENSAYSPLSVRYALEMMKEGAEGETKAQIDSLLGGVKTTRYENIAEHLALANAFWVRSSWQDRVKPGFVEKLKETLGAELLVDDFTSADKMNKWVEDNTLGLIKDAMSDESLQALEAALVNVLAIDMNWQVQYWPEMTDGGFFDFDNIVVAEGDDVTDDKYLTTTMRRWGGDDIFYNFAEDATILAQDLKEYNGTQLQFVAIMPKEDLEKYIETVSNADINRLLKGLRVAIPQNDTYKFSFTAYIPKFGIAEGGIEDLIADLKELGVADAFEPYKADFSGMIDSGDQPFYIKAMAHKTKFDFSEQGIRAAAITLGGLGAGAGPGPIPSSVDIVVSINRPFMYLVRDKKTGEVWFAGTVYEPNRWLDDKANYTWE